MAPISRGRKPLVSIAINNYNYGRYLGVCVRSAIEQTYPDVEVIVVDDGSQDESRQVAESFGNSVIPHFKPNGGQASALNVGLALAKGEIFLMLDSDDILRPDVIERIVDAWQEEFSKVQFQLELIDHTGRKLGVCIPTTIHEGDVTPVIRRFGSYASSPSSGNAYPRALLQKLFPIPERDWRVMADTYPIILAPFFGKVYCLDEPGGYYRIQSKPDKSPFVMSNRPASPGEALTRMELSRRLLAAELKTRGLIHTDDFPLETPGDSRIRLISRVVDGPKSPAYGTPLRSIVARSLRSIWRWPDFTLFARVVYSIWVVTVAVAPKLLANRLIVWAVNPQLRPRWLFGLPRLASRWRHRKRRAPSRPWALDTND